MITSLFFFALLAGAGVSLMTGPLGTMLIWQRMAYYGDTLAHATLLGASLSILLSINLTLSTIIVCILLAIIFASAKTERITNDTLLGILSHSTLAIGLIFAAALRNQGFDLWTFIYGDILAVNTADLILIGLADILVLSSLFWIWPLIIRITLHKDLAHAEGVPVEKAQLILKILLAIVIAIAMRIVGILLITALLIIPAAAARHFAETPKHMSIIATVFGLFAVCIGLFLSFMFDWPAGPAIVVSATAIYISCRCLSKQP